MANPSSNGEAGAQPDGGSPPSTPRWVYVFGTVVIVLVLVFVVLHLAGRGLGGHTPQ